MSNFMTSPLESLKAYMDLTRLHFFFVWPLLFCSGLFLSFPRYGGFSWPLVGKAALIALLGFEAGFVLNDYVDRDLDGRDVDLKLTRYWRPFGSRPLISGLVSPGNALSLFLILVVAASALVLTLPYPNSAYVLGIMAYSYAAEYFYQVRKRGQNTPIAQLIGRTDFTLFPVAGYLVNGRPDSVALLYFLFFYPFAQAHLGANDIIDAENDKARDLKTIPLLYGTKGAARWVLLFTLLHAGAAWLFISVQGMAATYGIIAGLLLLLMANVLILRGKTPADWLRALPLFHMAMLAYVASMILDFFI
jgi:4-hydroxybenzoate polyprenyltransferase